MESTYVANLNVAVAQAGETKLLTLLTLELDRIFIHIDVVGQALDGFLVKGKAHPSAPEDTLYSLPTDYTSPRGLVAGASGDLTTLAAAASGWLLLDVKGFYEISIYASSANPAGSSVSLFAGGA